MSQLFIKTYSIFVEDWEWVLIGAFLGIGSIFCLCALVGALRVKDDTYELQEESIGPNEQKLVDPES